MEWRHRSSPRPAPKNSENKNPLEKSWPRFLGIKTVSSSLIIFQRAKLSTRSITDLCWCILNKNAAGRSPRWSCSCSMPRLTGHLQPRRKWPAWASSVLITHPILRKWPRRTTTCSLDWKTIEWLPFFVRRGGHCCAETWLDGQPSDFFFEWLAIVRATGKEVYGVNVQCIKLCVYSHKHAVKTQVFWLHVYMNIHIILYIVFWLNTTGMTHLKKCMELRGEYV